MNQPVARVSQLIHCTCADAFMAFADPTRITKFWLASASAPLALSARLEWEFMVPGARDMVTVTEFLPERSIAFTWSDGTGVALNFTPHPGGGTEVSVEASGFSGADGVDQALDATEGFSIVLCDLKIFLETGSSPGLVRDKARLVASALESHRQEAGEG